MNGININNKKTFILNAVFCSNVVFTVAFEQFNAPLLKKGIGLHFLKKKSFKTFEQ